MDMTVVTGLLTRLTEKLRLHSRKERSANVMMQLGNLAIVVAKYKDCMLQICDNMVTL